MKRFVRVFSLIMCALLCWMPYSVRNIIGKAEMFEGKAECVIEAESGRILYESHGDLRLPMASTTKILTAITVLEIAEDLHEHITITPESVEIDPLRSQHLRTRIVRKRCSRVNFRSPFRHDSVSGRLPYLGGCSKRYNGHDCRQEISFHVYKEN